MPGLAIKRLPPNLHRQLKRRAARNHRSMTKELLAVLEQALGGEVPPSAEPPPFRGRFPLTDRFLDKAKRADRA
jgi:plasmid stability protein